MTPEPQPIPDLSIVIASYDSAPWLPSTIASLWAALERSTVAAEIVVVDDGSTDGTAAVLAELAAASPVPFRVVSQENRGRFLARWEGAQAARADRLLIFDSRLLMGEDSFAYLDRVDDDLGRPPWNGHVPTDPASPLVGRFWEVPTHIFWGDYLAHPRPTEISLDNFDRAPKGTGCLVIDKQLFLDACRAAWPEENAHLVSDDTKLLRFVCERRPLRLDPGFRALYRPRTTVRGFLRHAYDRGTLFVDSYAGTSPLRNAVLLALAIVPVLAVAALVVALAFGAWWAVAVIVAVVVLGIAAPAAAAAARRAPGRAVAAYLTYVVPFGAVFWAGLVRGLRVHRRSFAR
ncbi:glycosyltransferase family A protein [Leifsonia sp. SIMBA_070]|uniref:glycosyltransferase family A protein n=1 Tax=Leifsonia sp. SIMBA_070 TaxID=3085810 RepID=UPI00397DA6E1